MSSNTYSACLTPDPWLRRLVISSGCLFAVIGVLLILALPLDARLRLAASLFWSLHAAVEVRRFCRSSTGYDSIRLLAGGELQLRDSERCWVSASLQNGSVLLPRLAWLRFRLADGRQGAELLRGNARKSQEWRRLQVIWRHIGAAG